jgi:hypothetical protein
MAISALYEIADFLFNHKGDEIQVTEKLMNIVLEKSSRALIVLLEQRGDEIKATEKVIKAAARYSSKGIMELLLNKREEEIQITDKVVKIVTENLESVLALLFD